MKKHKIERVIKKQGGNFQVVFRDGMNVFWPRESAKGIDVGTKVTEYKCKNGRTAAFSWGNELLFVSSRPESFDDAVIFIENLKLFDCVPFNNAVIRAMSYQIDPLAFPDTEKFAHNIVLLGIKRRYGRLR